MTGTKNAPRLFTIGRSNHAIDAFIAVAIGAEIEVMAQINNVHASI